MYQPLASDVVALAQVAASLFLEPDNLTLDDALEAADGLLCAARGFLSRKGTQQSDPESEKLRRQWIAAHGIEYQASWAEPHHFGSLYGRLAREQRG